MHKLHYSITSSGWFTNSMPALSGIHMIATLSGFSLLGWVNSSLRICDILPCYSLLRSGSRSRYVQLSERFIVPRLCFRAKYHPWAACTAEKQLQEAPCLSSSNRTGNGEECERDWECQINQFPNICHSLKPRACIDYRTTGGDVL